MRSIELGISRFRVRIFDATRNAFPLPRLRVADRGLREGMLVEMMREDGALRAC